MKGGRNGSSAAQRIASRAMTLHTGSEQNMSKI
jgi:hypothetical protein